MKKEKKEKEKKEKMNMGEAKYYLPIKGKQIPIIVRNYQNSCTLKMYFKGNTLNISKPARMKQKELLKIIEQNKETISEQYEKINQKENQTIKHWYTGEKMLYQGETYRILVEDFPKNSLKIEIQETQKTIKLSLPLIFSTISQEERKRQIDKNIKKLWQRKTKEWLIIRVPYWSKKTQIPYQSFQVRDATSKFGSCIPKKKTLQFSNRLIMLPKDKIDAIIVHELCHMIYPNHQKEFYHLVEKFIPNYREIDQWLKENSHEIMI